MQRNEFSDHEEGALRCFSNATPPSEAADASHLILRQQKPFLYKSHLSRLFVSCDRHQTGTILLQSAGSCCTTCDLVTINYLCYSFFYKEREIIPNDREMDLKDLANGGNR